jgi:hypothetical protein
VLSVVLTAATTRLLHTGMTDATDITLYEFGFTLHTIIYIRRFNVFGRCWKPPGNTRWWAELELLIFLLESFDSLAAFCATADGDGDMDLGERMKRLKTTMEDDVSRAFLRFELVVVGIVGVKIIQATYNIEGDKCCALLTYDTIMECHDWLNDKYTNLSFPGLSEVMDECVATLLEVIYYMKG